MIESQPHMAIVNDTIAHFNTNIIAPIKDMKIYFNPVQEGEGDPSLENIRSINGWTGLDINQTGKNLINLSIISKQNNSSNIETTITNNTVTITAKKTSGFSVLSQQTFYWDIPQALRGKEIYFGVDSVTLTTNNENHRATIICEFKDKDNKFIIDPTVVSWANGDNNNTIARKYTIPQNATKLEMYFRIAQNVSTYGIIIGDSVTYNNFYIRYPANTYGYEEYNGNIISINWNNIGTIYGGYIDLIRGQIYSNYYQLLINSLTSESVHTVSRFADYDVYYFDMINLDIITASDADIPNMFFENYKVVSWNERLNNPRAGIVSAIAIGNEGTRIQIFTEKNAYETIENFIASFTNRIILLKRQTPIIYQLTPQQLRTFKGVNNIWSNTNGPISIQYWTH